MRPLTKPLEISKIENDVNLASAIDIMTSLNEPVGILDLSSKKTVWLHELIKYNYEMLQNKRLSHNNRINLSKFQTQLEWIYKNPSKKRKTNFIDDIRNAYVNNGILCPYCGVSPCRTLDHYYNKALLPQFAFLPENLIPCCGDCNKDKGAKKSFGAWRRIINPYYDDYQSLLQNEPLLIVIFKENPYPSVDMKFIVTANNNLPYIIKKHINFHLRTIKIEKLHQEMISNSFWRNAKQLRKYKELLDKGSITINTHRDLVDSFISINDNLTYDWEYIIRFSLYNFRTNNWIYQSNLIKLR
ncbi:hypothetical protein M976_01984 [Buttiauxella ferragutiae ATCC 51602]|jgi:5-methylcytosine-specific restriction endonuclease McrA|uniref:HNH nuclease domain-containing protein n=1 Tax=Buttiauxella ferragutiae ATCC 51602 TaxID=1354252 RepID=A0ABX2W8Z1_9ENTR|nr:hypothetical protein [Buttiauxella ferragutiae]OAT28145.1 hypothetical protein M976_01984 [Buttiauxella ferragutiae ATCC 51602]